MLWFLNGGISLLLRSLGCCDSASCPSVVFLVLHGSTDESGIMFVSSLCLQTCLCHCRTVASHVWRRFMGKCSAVILLSC